MNINRSRAAARISALLQKGGNHDLPTIARKTFTSEEQTRQVLRAIRKCIHVAEWRRQVRGPFVPLWQWGTQEDADKPEKLTPADWQRRYRAKKKANQ